MARFDTRSRSIDLRRTLGSIALLLIASIGVHAQTDTSLTATPDTSNENDAQRAASFAIGSADLDAELNTQDVSGILQSSNDVFTSTATYRFLMARFHIRGFDPDNTLVSMNGVLVNDLETGRATFTNWGGLNDVTRWLETRTGITPSRYSFAGIGGYSEIGLRASQLRKGFRFSYALTDRNFRHRLMATYNTGQMANGWAISISGSRRWANEGYVPGTSYDAGAYFISVEKKINEHHSISFTGLGAPITQGLHTLATQESYDLVGDHYYNSAWGYQDGVKRNSRMSVDHKPVLLLTHIYKPNDHSQWTTSLLYTWGRDGRTALNWYDAPDPRPDYYRYLPSYYSEANSTIAERLTSAWQNDVNTQQVNWEHLYFANGKNLYTVQNANGIAGNNVTGNRALYIVEDQRTDPARFGANTAWSSDLAKGFHLTVGGSYNNQKTHNYKLLNDLLGSDFYLDLDQFAAQASGDPNAHQNDLNTPNHVIHKGDIFGYDYDIHTRLINVFTQLEKKWRKLESYVGVSVSQSTFWREGHFNKANFPTSFGKGVVHEFTHFGLKGGAVYKLNGRHYFTGNIAFLTRPPQPRVAYLSPRTRDAVITNMVHENIFSYDLSYVVRLPKIQGRATFYYASITNQAWNRSFYHDIYRTFVNYHMTGVDQQHMGVEVGVQAKLSPVWEITAVYAKGDYTYTSRPSATITRDNVDTVLAAGRTVYWKNYKVGGVPQTAASLSLKYSSPKYWSLGASVNYFGDNYLDPNPDRRTTEALGNIVTEDPQWHQVLDQTKLADGYTVDLFFTKSWMIKRKYRIGFNLSVSNVLDNQDLITSGYEQMRYDPQSISDFPPKIGYMLGRTYFGMLTFSF